MMSINEFEKVMAEFIENNFKDAYKTTEKNAGYRKNIEEFYNIVYERKKRIEAIKLLNNFINDNSDGDERILLHISLAILEDELRMRDRITAYIAGDIRR